MRSVMRTRAVAGRVLLESRPAAPAAARRAVAQACRAWGAGILESDCELLVSELVTNAVVHGFDHATIALDLSFDGARLLVAVRQHGADGVAVPTTPSLDRESGRGLTIVDSIADEWGSFVVDDELCVWFALTC